MADGRRERVLSEAIRGLKTTKAVVLWANGRNTAIPSTTVEGSASTPPQPGGPHHLIEPDLTRLS